MNDIRLAVRLLGKNPGFALTAIVTLALAIGANTAVFSLVDAVLLKPLPYPQPERLAVVSREVFRGGAMVTQDVSHTGAVWEAVRDQVPSVDAAVRSGLSAQVSLVTGDRAAAVRPERVSAGFFRVLGVGPALGREFVADEDRPGGPAAAVLSDRLWRSALGGDPAAVGGTILLKGEPHTVVGIMPPSFRTSAGADLWTPVRAARTGEGAGENFAIVLRLRDRATWAQASAEIAAAADAAVRPPPASSGITFRHGVQPLQDAMASAVRRPLLLLWSAVGLVLLVACVNLAGLMLARAGSRSREIATRLAIGGSRRTIVRQILVESLVIAVAGGLAGVVVGAFALDVLMSRADGVLLTPWGDVGRDGRALLVTMGISVLTSVL
ncbi:MAG: ABC transporter permease, partial [Vicinamibacterales bacterium]